MSFLLALIFSFTTYASLENLTVKEGNFTYLIPSGTGDVEKIQLGLSKSLPMGPYPIEIFREANALVLKTEYIDFSWQDPMAFFHDMEKFYVQRANMSIGEKHHYFNSPKLIFQPKAGGEFTMDGFDFSCSGSSTEIKIEDRILDDCVEHLEGRIQKMDVPLKSSLAEFMKDLPEVIADADPNLPGRDFDMLMDKGDFKIDFRIKYYISAGIYAWGHMQYENNREVLAIRLDRVKYGYLLVTGLIFRKLSESVQNPNVTIEEPWIRIKLKRK